MSQMMLSQKLKTMADLDKEEAVRLAGTHRKREKVKKSVKRLLEKKNGEKRGIEWVEMGMRRSFVDRCLGHDMCVPRLGYVSFLCLMQNFHRCLETRHCNNDRVQNQAILDNGTCQYSTLSSFSSIVKT
jgi:hypothetical protein